MPPLLSPNGAAKLPAGHLSRGNLVLGVSMDRALLISFKRPSSPTEQAERSVIHLQKPLIRKSAEQTKLLETAQW